MGFKAYVEGTQELASKGKFRNTETNEVEVLGLEQYCMKVDKTMLKPEDDDAKRIKKHAGKHDQRS
jgi:hypothetical protein